MDFDRFYTDEVLALYRVLASSTDVCERRAILRQLADEAAKVQSELRKAEGKDTAGEIPH
jgi:hypothetical protein